MAAIPGLGDSPGADRSAGRCPVRGVRARNARTVAVWRSGAFILPNTNGSWPTSRRSTNCRRSGAEQLRRIDPQEVREQDVPGRDRLLTALENYAAWRKALPENERRQLDAAPNRAERMKIVRRLMEQQYVRKLPPPVRQCLAALPPEQLRRRGGPAARTRERLRRQRARDNMPARLDDFPPEVRDFVRKTLRPMLSDPDEKRPARRRRRQVADCWRRDRTRTVRQALRPATGYTRRGRPGAAWPTCPRRRTNTSSIRRHYKELSSAEGRLRPDYALTSVRGSMRQGEFQGRLCAAAARRPASWRIYRLRQRSISLSPSDPAGSVAAAMCTRRESQLAGVSGSVARHRLAVQPRHPRHESARSARTVGRRPRATPCTPTCPISRTRAALPGTSPCWSCRKRNGPRLKLSATDPVQPRSVAREEYYRRHPDRVEETTRREAVTVGAAALRYVAANPFRSGFTTVKRRRRRVPCFDTSKACFGVPKPWHPARRRRRWTVLKSLLEPRSPRSGCCAPYLACLPYLISLPVRPAQRR